MGGGDNLRHLCILVGERGIICSIFYVRIKNKQVSLPLKRRKRNIAIYAFVHRETLLMLFNYILRQQLTQTCFVILYVQEVPIFIVTYYIKVVTTSLTHGSIKFHSFLFCSKNILNPILRSYRTLHLSPRTNLQYGNSNFYSSDYTSRN